jgi:hypothetical protein
MASKVLLVLLLLPVAAQASGDMRAVLGDWEGESLCTIKESPCHDEHVIYHISPDSKDAAKLELSANKVVNGEELYMGSLECTYTASKQELACHYKKDDRWEFKVLGDTMAGTLTVPENKLYRKISVRRKASAPSP